MQAILLAQTAIAVRRWASALTIFALVGLTACAPGGGGGGGGEAAGEPSAADDSTALKNFLTQLSQVQFWTDWGPLVHASYLHGGETIALTESSLNRSPTSFAGATALSLGVPVTLTYTGTACTEHIFSFTLAAPARVRIASSDRPVLYDASGSFLGWPHEWDGTNYESFSIVTLNGGTYYLLITEYGGYYTGTGTVSVSASSAPETHIFGEILAGSLRYLLKEGTTNQYYIGWQGTRADGYAYSNYEWGWGPVIVESGQALLYGNQRQHSMWVGQWNWQYAYSDGTSGQSDGLWSDVWGVNLAAATLSVSGNLRIVDYSGNVLPTPSP